MIACGSAPLVPRRSAFIFRRFSHRACISIIEGDVIAIVRVKRSARPLSVKSSNPNRNSRMRLKSDSGQLARDPDIGRNAVKKIIVVGYPKSGCTWATRLIICFLFSFAAFAPFAPLR